MIPSLVQPPARHLGSLVEFESLGPFALALDESRSDLLGLGPNYDRDLALVVRVSMIGLVPPVKGGADFDRTDRRSRHIHRQPDLNKP